MQNSAFRITFYMLTLRMYIAVKSMGVYIYICNNIKVDKHMRYHKSINETLWKAAAHVQP